MVFLYNENMIALLRGTIIENDDRSVVIDVCGVGYRVFCIPRDLAVISSKKNKEYSLFTYQHVRENAIELYGFVSREEESMFEILITVSGIGPKGAIGVLSSAPVDVLKRSIVAEDSSILTRISGIGKKISEKIIVELKDKFGEEWGALSGDIMEESEVAEALLGLGYVRSEVLGALKEIPEQLSSMEEKMKEALKILGKK